MIRAYTIARVSNGNNVKVVVRNAPPRWVSELPSKIRIYSLYRMDPEGLSRLNVGLDVPQAPKRLFDARDSWGAQRCPLEDRLGLIQIAA